MEEKITEAEMRDSAQLNIRKNYGEFINDILHALKRFGSDYKEIVDKINYILDSDSDLSDKYFKICRDEMYIYDAINLGVEKDVLRNNFDGQKYTQLQRKLVSENPTGRILERYLIRKARAEVFGNNGFKENKDFEAAISSNPDWQDLYDKHTQFARILKSEAG